MKVKTPFSGLEAEFHIFADDRQCSEYILAKRPTNNNDKQPIKECYVTVSDNQIITIAGHLTGRLSRARFDLVVDGSFVGTRQVEPDKDGQAKLHNRRRIEFRSINTVVAAEEGEGDKTKVVDGELVTQRLDIDTDERYLFGSGSGWGVGSIVLIISVEESFSCEGYWPDRIDYPDRVLGNWEYRQDAIQNSGVGPTHCLGLVNVNRNVIPQKCNKFYNQFEGTRFGSRPVAKLAFYYRNKAAILDAGCMPCPDKPYPVQEEFEEEPPIRSESSQSPRSIGGDPSTSLFMASPHDVQHAQQQAKLGGTLVLPRADPSQVKSFYELTIGDELAREQSRSGFLHRERQGSVMVADTVGAAIAASRTVTIAGKNYVMLSIRSIDELMPVDGIAMTQLLYYVFPSLPKEDQNEAADILIRHMQGFAVVRKNKAGRLICIRTPDVAEYSVEDGRTESRSPEKEVAGSRTRPGDAEPHMQQIKRRRSFSSESGSPTKRSRPNAAKPHAQETDMEDPRAEVKRKAKERLDWLRQESKRMTEEAEKEAAALAELEEDEQVLGPEEPQRDAGSKNKHRDAGTGMFDTQAIGYLQGNDSEEDAEGESDVSNYLPDA